MTELSRSLLAAAREGLAPDAAVPAGVRAKVAAAVAAGAAGATAAATTALPAPAQAATASAQAAAVTAPAATVTAKAVTTSSILLKLGAAIVAAGAVAGAVVVGRGERTPEAPHLAVPASEPDELRTDVRVAAPNEPDDPRTMHRAPVHGHGAPVVGSDTEGARPAAASRGERTADAAAPAPEPCSLSREVELIDLAMVSLRKNAPLAAIEAIRVFDRETLGQGQMAEDAAAIAIEAHCTLGDDVTDALAEFDRKWPSSAQRERLQTACFGR